MPEDEEASEVTDAQFAELVNHSWDEPTMQFKIVENTAFIAIMLGLVGGVALMAGAVVWVWKQVL